MKITNLLVILLTSALCLSSCGEDDKLEKVEISVIPDTPIVFTGDGAALNPISGELEVITAPWFEFRVTIDNKLVVDTANKTPEEITADTTAKTVTIMGIEVKSTDIDGVETVTGFAPSSFNLTKFAEIAPGGNFNNIGSSTLRFFVQALTQTSSFRYRSSITFQGWFGTESEQVGRFTKTINISTE